MRVKLDGFEGHWTTRLATDADLAALGYYRRPTCDMCYGTGTHPNLEQPNFEHVPCPKCGRSGYLPMVALDVDVEALREMSELWDRLNPTYDTLLLDLARQVLAALDGEET